MWGNDCHAQVQHLDSRTCHRDIAEQIVGFRVSSGGKKGLIAFTRGKNIFRR